MESAVPVTTEIKLRGRAKSAQGVRNRARVLIVNSHPITRMGLGDLINGQPDLVVCDEAGNAAEALQTLKKKRAESCAFRTWAARQQRSRADQGHQGDASGTTGAGLFNAR